MKDIELLMLVPGSSLTMRVTGSASLYEDTTLLDKAAIKNKRPKLGILLEGCRFEIRETVSIIQADAWKPDNQLDEKQLTRFPKVLSAHMNGDGVIGKAMTPIVKAIVKHDMNHLY